MTETKWTPPPTESKLLAMPRRTPDECQRQTRRLVEEALAKFEELLFRPEANPDPGKRPVLDAVLILTFGDSGEDGRAMTGGAFCARGKPLLDAMEKLYSALNCEPVIEATAAVRKLVIQFHEGKADDGKQEPAEGPPNRA